MTATDKTKPLNLLILCPDQWRADYLGCYGHSTIGTQHIDRLAAEGVRFDRSYCAAPLCGPSRISFVTSLRFSEHGRRNYHSTIDFSVPNLISTLKQAGYRTGMFGKNHCFHYDQLGDIWDELHEFCLGNYDGHPKYKRAHTAFELEADHPFNVTASLTDEAMGFIDRSPLQRPFVCWLNWQDPHPAFCCPPPYSTMFDPADIELPSSWRGDDDPTKPRKLNNWRHNSRAVEATESDVRAAIAKYMGQCRYVDDQVGRIMSHLESTGKLDDTLVLFFSDHGELLGDFGVFHKIPTFHECLARIPTIIRYPRNQAGGAPQPTVFRGLVEEVDFSPTLLDALGVERPSSMVGESWHSAIVAGDDAGRESVLCEAGLQQPTEQAPVPEANHLAPFPPNSHGPGAMVGDGRYKLSMYADDTHELYDLQADPHEVNNLWDDPKVADVQQRLMELLVRRLLGVGMRPSGAWRGSGADLRFNPPEGTQPKWHAGQLLKVPRTWQANQPNEPWPMQSHNRPGKQA